MGKKENPQEAQAMQEFACSGIIAKIKQFCIEEENPQLVYIPKIEKDANNEDVLHIIVSYQLMDKDGKMLEKPRSIRIRCKQNEPIGRSKYALTEVQFDLLKKYSK